MARFSFSIFPNSGGKIMECLPWILCCFGCNEERVSWRQKSVFCLIVAIFNHRKICSSWRFALLLFPSNLSFVPIVEFLDSNMDLKGTVKRVTVTLGQIRIFCLFSPYSLLGLQKPWTGVGAQDDIHSVEKLRAISEAWDSPLSTPSLLWKSLFK